MTGSPPAFSNTADAPNVSVIVPIYNGAQDMEALGTCLLAQTIAPATVEFLLVDNNSQDHTPQLLQSWADQAREQGFHVKVLLEAEIQSSYAARNRGIRSASGEILVFTDADCRPEPTWLANMVQPFEDSQVGLVVGEIKALPGDSLLEAYAEHRETLSQKFTIAHSFYPYGQTANLAVRRVAFAKAGLFRPYLTTGGDADLCWRVQLSGPWQLQFAADAVVRHRHRATLKELANQWRRYGRSNRYLHELYGVPLQPPLTFRKAAYLVTRWGLKGLPSTLWQVLQGKAAAVQLICQPLDLFCGRSRDLGQAQAQLSEPARAIEWLGHPPSPEELKALSVRID
ncbi:MAG: glycosyltransferase [Cyanobacteria bacterium J06638_28]